MKRIQVLLPLLFFFQAIVIAQEKGVKFQHNLTWDQVLMQAKKENKTIFVDCYATWCGPCKAMDKEVYSKDQIGNFVNSRFISVKVQMDSTNNDSDDIRMLFPIAKKFQTEYSITALPSFLFFSPDGQPLHKAIGYKNEDEFLKMSREALDSTKQYYSIVRKYEQGKLHQEEILNLGNLANSLGDKSKSREIALKFKTDYLDNIPDSALCSKKNLDFLSNNLNILTSKDKIFKICISQPNKTDSIIEKFSEFVTLTVINKEEIDSKLWRNGKPISLLPNWDNIEHSIREKYGNQIVKKIVPDAKLRFYRKTSNWGKFAEAKNQFILNNPPQKGIYGMGSDISNLNDDAWIVFLDCTDPKILSDALNWINLAIKISNQDDPIYYAYFDTKANLQYKLGNIEEAIATEQQAINFYKQKNDQPWDFFEKVIAQMKAGKPTWNVKLASN